MTFSATTCVYVPVADMTGGGKINKPRSAVSLEWSEIRNCDVCSSSGCDLAVP